MPPFKDHLGRLVNSPETPRRIVSLCPSQTETLLHFDLPGEVVGRTRFCIHPQDLISQIQQVGGTKEIHLDRIRALEPDLIICEKEENTPEMVAELEKEFPVYVTDVVDVESGIQMIRDLGLISGVPGQGNALADEVGQGFRGLKSAPQDTNVLYFIWRKPWMVVGEDTYIDDILSRMGLANPARFLTGRYPEIKQDQLREISPELILLSSEPYPFREKHMAELQQLCPASRIELVDGEMFTWYGSRMLLAPGYLNQLLETWFPSTK